MNKLIYLFVVFLLILPILSQFNSPHSTCFCKIGEIIDNCICNEKSIDVFNNAKIYPALQSILQKEPFKFYKVNMAKPCPFWDDDSGECSSKKCTIDYCDEEVPIALRKPAIVSVDRRQGNEPNASVSLNGNGSPQEGGEICTNGGQESNKFDPLDASLSDVDKAQLRELDIFEAETNCNNFCEVEGKILLVLTFHVIFIVSDEHSNDMHYVNLAKNPERYTGFKGNSALKVWKCIYSENCFKPDPKFDKNFLLNPTQTGMCQEKRVFYQLISSLHSAITISIAAHNYRPATTAFGEGTWYRNSKMFEDRFGTKWSKEGPERLKNIYFTYMLELRALVKAAPYIQKGQLFYTGNEKDDVEVHQALEHLFDLLKQFPNQFDETQLFSNFQESDARLLREEFRQHFWNISRIMDCVGCDKCRLWGKVQTHGMGTALKILFADLPRNGLNNGGGSLNTNPTDIAPFKLTRNDVVALFQSFGRYASSIWEINQFRKEMTGKTEL